jgi:hypothetical protein
LCGRSADAELASRRELPKNKAVTTRRYLFFSIKFMGVSFLPGEGLMERKQTNIQLTTLNSLKRRVPFCLDLYVITLRDALFGYD